MIPAIPKLKYTDSNRFFVMAGPCAIEGRDMAFAVAEHLVKVSEQLQLPLIFGGWWCMAVLSW